MIALVPIDTATALPTQSQPGQPNYTLSQALAAGQTAATFNLASLGLSVPPSNIVPQVVRTNGSESIAATPVAPWTASSFICNFVATPDSTFVCIIQIYI